MKYMYRLVALLVVACLFSCNQQPKVVEPLEWNFDLLWKVAQAIPDDARLGDFGQESSMNKVKEYYNDQVGGNSLVWFGEDEAGNDYSSYLCCYPYAEQNKLLVVYQTNVREGDRNKDEDHCFDYDLKKGKMTPVALPIQPLGFKDFFDGILLADLTPAKVRAYEEEGKVVYGFGGDDYDLLTYYMIPSEAYLPDFEYGLSDRENRLVFDWDGKSFVHHPEKDLLGYSIYEDGFCSMDFETEIPEQFEGFDMERQTFMAEGEEQVKYVITKDGTLVMELFPEYDFSKGAFTNTLGTINIYSDRYQTFGEFHVGSTFSEVMDTYSEYATTILTADGRLMVDVEGIQFMFDPEDYQGELPEVTSDEGAFILTPSIKPDAKVKMIRLYPMVVG